MFEYWVPTSVALFWGHWNLWEVGPRSKRWSTEGGASLMFYSGLIHHLRVGLIGYKQAGLPPAAMPPLTLACTLRSQPRINASELTLLLIRDLVTVLGKVSNSLGKPSTTGLYQNGVSYQTG